VDALGDMGVVLSASCSASCAFGFLVGLEGDTSSDMMVPGLRALAVM
jgi:hypothetical protein